MLARTDSRARAVVLLLLLTLVAGAIGGRLVWWQLIERDWLAARALEQLAQQHEIPAERGAIRDINGELIATTVELQSIFATPPTVEEKQGNAALLAGALGLPVEEIRAKLNSGLPYVWLKRRVAPEVADRVRSLDIEGVGMLPETQRVYPMTGAAAGTTIAAQIVGYVNVDGVGQYGVEEGENALLAGVPGSIVAQEDVVGRRIADSIYQLREPINGADLTLTIDAGVQHLLEAEMWETYRDNQAEGVIGIIMDVNTGAIVAMASYPSFDANAYAATDPALFVNPAVTRQYEPGSVMKAFTVAAALDAQAITTHDTFLDDNNLVVRGARIQNADRFDWPYGHGPLTAADVLKLSNNVGAARIGLELGGRGLYEAFRHYGFGSPTGIEIAGEASGLVWSPDDPSASGELTTAQNAFGQGLVLTAMQLVTGYAAIANGGTLMTPHVIAGWTDVDGIYHPTEQPPGERIMRRETSETVLRMLVGAIDDGIASGAGIPGYSVAGKTGTAQIAGPVEVEVPDGVDEYGEPKTKVVTETRYIDGWVDSSFVGIVPASDPQFVTLVLLHRPSVWGRYQMAERPESVYAELMPQVLDYLAVPPDRPIPAVARP